MSATGFTRVLPFACTIPVSTPPSAPVTIAINLDTWDVNQFDLEVPSGPSGLMGFQIYNNGVAWLPYGSGQWFVWDDVYQSFPVFGQPNASGWALVGYNNDGFYPHTVTVRAHVTSALAADTPTVVPQVTIVTTPIVPDPVTL